MSHSVRRPLVMGFAVLLLVAFAAAAWAYASAGSPQAAAAKSGTEFQLDLSVGVPAGTGAALVVSNIGSSGQDGVRYQVDSFFDIIYANIGSSGQDGVRASEANFDSFFDITYDLDFSSSDGRTFDTEMISMSLRAHADDPAGALDAVVEAVRQLKGRVYYGHVTVLK